MAGPVPSKELLQGTLTQARRRSEVSEQPSTLGNSLGIAALATLSPLAAGNAAVEQAISAAWSRVKDALSDDAEVEQEKRQAEEAEVERLVEKLGILGRNGKDEWRKHVNDPVIASWLRAHPARLDPRAADPDFQRWLRDPSYEPAGAIPAQKKVVPTEWKQAPQVQETTSAATQITSTSRQEAGTTAPGTASLDVNQPYDVNMSYDEATGRHVVTVNGTPFAAIVAAKETPLQVNLEIADGIPRLEVTGGPHVVIPLLGPPRGSITSEPVAYSETPLPDATPPATEGKKISSGEVLEQRARENWLQGTSPRQRWEAAQRGGPPQYMGKLERSLLEFERTLKLFPGGRAGVSYAQVYWGEDILGNQVDRWQAFKEGTIALAEDLTSVFEPEDLIELGGGRAAAGARTVEEGLAVAPDFHPNVAPPSIAPPPVPDVPLRDFDRSPVLSPLEQQLREGSLFSPKPAAAPPIPEAHIIAETAPKKTPGGALAEARLEKPPLSPPQQATKIEQPIELSLSAPHQPEPVGVTTIELHGPAQEAGAVKPREVGQAVETSLHFPANSAEAKLAELEREQQQLAQRLAEAREQLTQGAKTPQERYAIRSYEPTSYETRRKQLEQRIRAYQNVINDTGARGEALNELRRVNEAGVTNFRTLQKPGGGQGLDAVFDKATDTGKKLGVDEVKASIATAKTPTGAQAQHKAYFVDRVNYNVPSCIETRQAILDGEYQAIEINSVKINDIDVRTNTAKRVETLEAVMTPDEFKFLDNQRQQLGRERFLRKYNLKSGKAR